MAGKKENLKALFANTRSRVIILATFMILVITVIVGLVKVYSSLNPAIGPTAGVTSAPAGIQSIPGQKNQTAQYAGVQTQQNVAQAKAAFESGKSVMPTIVSTQGFGNGIDEIGPKNGRGVLGFSTLALKNITGPQQSLWLQSLKNANCSKSSVNSVVSQGALPVDLKGACTCIQLKDDGYSFADLKPLCSCTELKGAGFNATQMRQAGSTAEQLRLCGFDACELHAAGFTAQQMKDGGYSDGELKGAGYSETDIAQAAGLPNGMTADDVRNAGCTIDGLARLRKAGVTASAIRQTSGCSAAQLKAAGFSAEDLKNAGFSAADLLKAGFTPAELKQAGFTARDLMDAGVSTADLLAAGFTPKDLKVAEAELPKGVTEESVKEAGCNPEALKRERLAGISAASIHQFAGCTAQALKAAGFTDDDLSNAGFTPAEIQAAQLIDSGSSPADDALIKAAGCDPKKLHALFLQKISAQRIHALNGCSAAALKAAGFSAKDLADAGFTPQELLAAGFTPQDLMNAGLSPVGVIAAGRTANCSVDSLKAAHALGVSASTIKRTLGCSANQMKDAGYTATELKAAGFTAAELKAAGFTAAELKNAGFSAKELRAAGFDAKELKDAGFNAIDLKDAGFSAASLKNAGFSAEELRKAGFSASDLKKAGFNSNQLKNAGFSAQELQDAGFSPNDTALAGLQELNPTSPPSAVTALPSINGHAGPAASDEAANRQQLQVILKKQQAQMADQQFQQKVQQRSAAMLGAANTALSQWKQVPSQVYAAGTEPKAKATGLLPSSGGGALNAQTTVGASTTQPLIKAGDVLFAVLDTSVNSDEPGPILATIVSGKLNGSKLIGSFTLPTNSDKIVINFTTMSVPGAPKTTSINAYGIDPNTARTALATKANHHYLLRYGSLFASTFIEGFGNAFQSANTTVTIGGVGGATNTTIANGVGRTTLENAVIGLATLGKSWSQVAQQQFNTPTTVQVCSGTGMGILFTQDLASL